MSKRHKLQGVWAALFFFGAALVFYDAFIQPLVEIRGVPALGVVGAALILLTVTSILNWTFKEAWEEHRRANHDPAQ